ncbi:hypothetical protein [Kitasatospora sp. NPDC093558]|uniref:DUF7683 domain-containing protein n=1 Tax=Kitasatospora sp. NPDC093558 TaxID=3155201 RepID=UPI00342CBC1B
MGWYVEAFERDGDGLLAEYPLPGFTEADAVRLVGDHPDMTACFPLDAGQLAVLAGRLGTVLEPEAAAYFLSVYAD